MLDKDRFNLLSPNFFLSFALVGFAALWFSPFLVSVSTAAMALLAIPSYKSIWREYRNVVLSLLLILVLSALDMLRKGDDASIASAKFGLLIGLFFLLLSAVYFFQHNKKNAVVFILFSSLIVLIVNVLAVGNYFLYKTYYDELLLQSKSIPVLNMHHIHFGIINASVIFCLFGVLHKKLVDNWKMTVSWIALALIFICFHILSSRTGVLAFYSGAMLALLGYSLYTKAYKILFFGLVLGALSILVAASVSTSFNNKISNSVEDYQSIIKGGKEINFKSMAMRLEANKMCLQIIADHPFIGVGASNQDTEMQKMYSKHGTLLLEENRVGPHNQFLEFGVKYGVIGIVSIVVLLLIFVLPYKQNAYLFYGFICLLFISMLFESLLERQASIYFTSLFLGVGYSLFYGQIAKK
jgi:O-antigen ligase